MYHRTNPLSHLTNKMSLDFVRERLAAAERANAELRGRLEESERRLTVLQTAQAWALDDSGCWSETQSQKVKELTLLLERAHEAEKTLKKAESKQQGGVSKKVLLLRHQVEREKQEKLEMYERMQKAFEGAKLLRQENHTLRRLLREERANFGAETKKIRQNYQREIDRFRNEIETQTLFTATKAAALNAISRRVVDDLQVLEQKLAEVQQPPESLLLPGNTLL
jgi:hypothetical protein